MPPPTGLRRKITLLIKQHTKARAHIWIGNVLQRRRARGLRFISQTFHLDSNVNSTPPPHTERAPSRTLTRTQSHMNHINTSIRRKTPPSEFIHTIDPLGGIGSSSSSASADARANMLDAHIGYKYRSDSSHHRPSV